jgi:hypothetical protein
MCNAQNHSAGCTCGFGPPYPDKVTFGAAREWAEEVLKEPWLVRRGLKDLAWDASSIDEFESAYGKIRSSDLSHLRMVERINELLGRRRQVEEEVWNEMIKVPLYRFSAPRVKGATVLYSEGEEIAERSSWVVKVFAVGTGHSRELQVTHTRTYAAEFGACKQVFVPVKLRVARVAVFDRDRLLSRGFRAEVAVPKGKDQLSLRDRGCDNLPATAGRDGVDADYFDTVTHLLAGDTTKSVHRDERSWRSNIGRDVSLHLKNIVEVGPLVRVQRVRRLSLLFALPAGHDYRGYVSRGGLWWDN